jgi:hypothetical protein
MEEGLEVSTLDGMELSVAIMVLLSKPQVESLLEVAKI